MVSPSAVALLTAFAEQEKDYNWYIHINKQEAILLNEVKPLCEAFITDRQGDSPRILVYLSKNRIALLIGHLITNRKDVIGHLITNRKDAVGKRIISDTLYLEFEAQHAVTVLSAAATLLVAFDANSDQYKDYERIFLDYCENDLIPRYQKDDLTTPSAIDLPICELDNSDDTIIYPSEVAIFSDPTSREKCARYLRQLAKASAEGNALPESLIFVSTGRVDKEDIQKYADTHTEGDLIVLTLSTTVEGEIDLRTPYEVLQNTTDNLLPETVRKWIPRKLRFPFTGGTLVFLVGILLWLLFQDRTPPQLASLTLQSVNLMENPGKPVPRFGPEGALRLTFTDNKAMSPDTPPRLTLDAAEGQTLSFPQPCTLADEQGQTWECPAAVAAADPNQTEPVALTIAEVTDRAGNPMTPVTVELIVESAAITAQVVSPIKLVQRDSTPIARIMIHAEAKYGVAAVAVNGVQAEREAGQANLWQAELLAAALAQSSQPASITVTDTYGNTIETGL